MTDIIHIEEPNSRYTFCGKLVYVPRCIESTCVTCLQKAINYNFSLLRQERIVSESFEQAYRSEASKVAHLESRLLNLKNYILNEINHLLRYNSNLSIKNSINKITNW